MRIRMDVSPSRWVVLAVLTAMNTLLALDKSIFLILLEPIRREFMLSDLALGSLSGLAFALCMGVAGIPLGVLADRVNRRNMAAICCAVWSGMTMACGLAQSYPQLIAARMCVGLGEAGGGPSAIAMLGEVFAPRRRGLAMSIFTLGLPMSTLISYTVGTRISADYGWRAALIAAGLPGLLVAVLIFLLVRLPSQGTTRPGAATRDGGDASDGFGPALRHMASTPSFIFLAIGLILAYTATAGSATFAISFLVRAHGAVLKDIGPLMGVLFVTFGVLVTAPAGWLADHLALRDERWRAWLLAVGLVCSLPVAWLWLNADSLGGAMLLNAMFSGFAVFWMGPVYGFCQSLVPAQMRGKAIALLLLVGNTGGYVIGPALVGLASDLLKPRFGDDSLRYAIMSIIPFNLFAAAAFLQLARHLRSDLARIPGPETHLRSRSIGLAREESGNLPPHPGIAGF